MLFRSGCNLASVTELVLTDLLKASPESDIHTHRPTQTFLTRSHASTPVSVTPCNAHDLKLIRVLEHPKFKAMIEFTAYRDTTNGMNIPTRKRTRSENIWLLNVQEPYCNLEEVF